MPLMDAGGRTFGLGEDIELLPLDPKGFGVRNAPPEEAAAVLEQLEAFGFRRITSPMVFNVYFIEDGTRRHLVIDGEAVRVFPTAGPVLPQPEDPPADVPPADPDPTPEHPPAAAPPVEE